MQDKKANCRIEMTSCQVKQKMLFNADVVLCSNFRMFQKHSEVIFKITNMIDLESLNVFIFFCVFFFPFVWDVCFSVETIC